MSGWVAIHRAIMDSPDLHTPAERWAMVWMVLHAAWEPTVVPCANRRTITVQRGQFSHSTRHLSTEWGMSEPAVRRLLKRLEERRTIRRSGGAERDAGQLVVTVCNYEAYQSPLKKPDAVTDAPSDALTDANINKETNKQTKPPLPPKGGEADVGFAKVRRGRGKPGYVPRPDSAAQRERFVRFWAIYPNREEEAKAYAKFRCFCDQDQEDLVWAAGEYVQRLKAKNKLDFAFKAKNWLNRDPSSKAEHGGWSDFITPSDENNDGTQEQPKQPGGADDDGHVHEAQPGSVPGFLCGLSADRINSDGRQMAMPGLLGPGECDTSCTPSQASYAACATDHGAPGGRPDGTYH